MKYSRRFNVVLKDKRSGAIYEQERNGRWPSDATVDLRRFLVRWIRPADSTRDFELIEVSEVGNRPTA